MSVSQYFYFGTCTGILEKNRLYLLSTPNFCRVLAGNESQGRENLQGQHKVRSVKLVKHQILSTFHS